MKTIRLGCGAAWARDRFDHAPDLVARGKLDYLCFDSMSEVTMSAAQVAKMEDASTVPYDPYLVERMRPILQDCKRNGIRIVTNQGWLDPVAAARRLVQLARELGIEGLKVAAVSGGVLHQSIAELGVSFTETGRPVAEARERILSAEVYLGAEGIVQALADGADVVVTTRVADACVYLGPLAHEFGWSFDDCHAMARGMIIGHLMECGTQITGGYFADPGYKDVPDLANVGAPIAEVTEAAAFITKLPGTGGVVSEATCKEQLIYEVQDPSSYFCPDCIADLTRVSFRQAGPDRVEVLVDRAGRPKTDTLKALIGLDEGFMTEEMVLFAGPGALARAQLTQQILHERFRKIGLRAKEMRMDYVGLNAVHRESTPPAQAEPYEVVLRIAVRTDTRAEADKLRKEVDPLAVNGTYGTGKWSTTSPGSRVRPVVGLSSALVPRRHVPFTVSLHTGG
ncbi:acyclic terpene utilization AtuA family protein [Bordetella petrii]|nr:acyclic terpene utilization AtuA family protein [Bordetella petrii]